MWVRQAGAPLVGSPRPVQPRHAAPLHQRGWPHSAPRTPPSPPPPGERPLPPPAECCRTAPARNRGSPPPSLGRDKTVVTQNFVSQRSYLFPGTVGENLCFGPEQCGSTLQEEEVAALLEAVGLVGYGERNVATLSGGEVQRVAVARALANQPEVLLLDEPTSALDKAARAGVEWHIQRVIGEWGLACVMVTHDEEQARRMAGVALVLGEGRVEAMGPAMEVLGA